MQAAKHTTALLALFSLLLGCTACVSAQEVELPVPPPLVPRAVPLVAPDTIAIGIAVQVPRIRLSAPGGLLAWNVDGVPHILPDGELTAQADTSGIRWWLDPATPASVSAGWDVRPMAAETFVLNGVRYRGILKLLLVAASETAPPRLTAVNVLPLEDYLRGVVPREIGTTRPEVYAAIQAQAVAARTYTVRNLGRRRALGFDLHATPDDQVYGGAGAEQAITDSAIRSTAGQVLAFGNDLVEAFYHSTCGGHTTARSDAWGGDQPYLRGVPDLLGHAAPVDPPARDARNPEAMNPMLTNADSSLARSSVFDTVGHPAAACASSRYFRWTERYAGETLARLMAPADTIGWNLESRDTGGRVLRLTLIRGESTTTARGDAIRWMLRRPGGEPLRSTLFDLSWDSGVFVVRGRGWGHGIGLCQVGALGRARAGESWQSILAHYYPGTALRRLESRAAADAFPSREPVR